jgi:predicted nucleotidyltransferase
MSQELTPSVIAILRAMHPQYEKWFYTRELAKLAEVSTWAVSREFSKLVKRGIIKEKREGRERYYRLDISKPQTRALCTLFETERRERLYKGNRRLAWSLEELAKRTFDSLPQVQCLVLFGSAARGEMAKASDVDILVVVPTLEQEAFNKLMKSVDSLAGEVRGTYGLPLSPLTMRMRDWEAAVREKKRIARDVLREGIVLFGEDRYYRLLARVIEQ